MNDLVTFQGEGNAFFMSFSAMLRTENLLIEQWTASMVDQTLSGCLVPKSSAIYFSQTIIFIK